MARFRVRISESFRIGPFRLRLSEGRGGVWGSAGVKIGRRGYVGASERLGGKRGRRRA